MKKLTSLFLAIILVFGTTICFAHDINIDILGTHFYVNDEWREIETDDGSYQFTYYEGKRPNLTIEALETGLRNESDIEKFKDQMSEECAVDYSDSRIKEYLYKLDNHFYEVTTDSVVENIEYYNGVKYYRYEKAYTVARSYGSSGFPYYMTVFITINKGILYKIKYESPYNDRRMNDVFNILNTAHYGKIIDIYVNGKEVIPDTYPEIYNDRTLVPIRAIVEELGYNVEWDEENRAVYIHNDEVVLGIYIDYYVMEKMYFDTLEVEQIELDVPALIAADRTYIPLRAVGEALNCDVNWIGETRTININSK